MPIYALGDRRPVIDPDAYVSPQATVIGEVTIARGASVWPGAALVPEDLVVPAGSMALGVPVRVKPIDPAVQASWIGFAVNEYVNNARTYRDELRLIEPDRTQGATDGSREPARQNGRRSEGASSA